MGFFEKIISWYFKRKENQQWSKITKAVKTQVPLENVAPVKLNVVNEFEAPWMDIAHKEIGVSEVGGGRHNPRIIEYHAATSLHAISDETPWCSAFACWVLKKAGYKTTNSAWARSWLNYGLPIPKPRYGCIAVYERNGPGGDAHVCFWVGHDGNDDHCLGGNQSNSVCFRRQEKSKLLGYRWPVK
jgi:uncharacterized protein (TIGR02594 family)